MRGIRCRGGHTASVAWSAGVLTRYTLMATAGAVEEKGTTRHSE